MNAAQAQEVEKVGAIDWALLLPLILPLLKSLVEKNDHATKNGYDGPLTAFIKSYERVYAEMKKQ